jgi:nicotinate-nucleotide adenylyltransferase
MLRIGICGGTFDPFHRGHLEPVIAVRDEMQWDRVVYVPAWVQPFKQDRSAASAYHRHAMIVLATHEYDWIRVDPRELVRGGVSYTVDTLEELRREHPESTLDWIIGDDSLARLHEWKSIDRVFELANFVVLTRDAQRADESLGDGPEACRCAPADRPGHGAIVFAANEAVPVSATGIRQRLAAGEPVDELVDARVSRYIHQYALYGKGPS